VSSFRNKILKYLSLTYLGEPGRYASVPGGKGTLYASCYAVMILHYLGELEHISAETKESWVDFICSYQDPTSGYFEGPEILQGKLLSDAHSKDHLLEHLSVHVLPAVKLLGGEVRYPLTFAKKYANPVFLEKWLSERDWSNAWLEGNNLLFVGQLLTYLSEDEGDPLAGTCLDILFYWLDNNLDPETGLWGTNGYVDNYKAVYGGYHQLLLYYYHEKPVRFMDKIVDITLSLQHLDGGFSKHWGGGGCQDVDAVDILVNMYKRNDYRRNDIQLALKKCYFHMKRRFKSTGGFVYRNGSDFIHMGMSDTYSKDGCPDMFSTWFGLHTMCLIAEIIKIPPLENIQYAFNETLSMGWHKKSLNKKNKIFSKNHYFDLVRSVIVASILTKLRSAKSKFLVVDVAYKLFKNQIMK